MSTDANAGAGRSEVTIGHNLQYAEVAQEKFASIREAVGHAPSQSFLLRRLFDELEPANKRSGGGSESEYSGLFSG